MPLQISMVMIYRRANTTTKSSQRAQKSSQQYVVSSPNLILSVSFVCLQQKGSMDTANDLAALCGDGSLEHHRKLKSFMRRLIECSSLTQMLYLSRYRGSIHFKWTSKGTACTVYNLHGRSTWSNAVRINTQVVHVCIFLCMHYIARSVQSLGYRLDDRNSIPGGAWDFFLFTTASKLIRGPIQPPIQWVPGVLPGDKATGEWIWPVISILCRS